MCLNNTTRIPAVSIDLTKNKDSPKSDHSSKAFKKPLSPSNIKKISQKLKEQSQPTNLAVPNIVVSKLKSENSNSGSPGKSSLNVPESSPDLKIIHPKKVVQEIPSPKPIKPILKTPKLSSSALNRLISAETDLRPAILTNNGGAIKAKIIDIQNPKVSQNSDK